MVPGCGAHRPAPKLVFVNESGMNTARTRTAGASRARGQRIHGAVPHGDWKTVTMLAAIRASGMPAAPTALFSADTDMFRLFVTHELVPARCTVGMWRCGTGCPAQGRRRAKEGSGMHRSGVDAVAAARRSSPRSPYSPDLSPIEPYWSKVMEIVRAVGPRDERSIVDATAKAFAAVTSDDARAVD